MMKSLLTQKVGTERSAPCPQMMIDTELSEFELSHLTGCAHDADATLHRIGIDSGLGNHRAGHAVGRDQVGISTMTMPSLPLMRRLLDSSSTLMGTVPSKMLKNGIS